MDTRKRGIHSLPNNDTETYITKQKSKMRTCPPCPRPPKVIRTKIHKRLFCDEKTAPRAVFFSRPVSLSRSYNPDKDMTYLEQLYLMSGKIGEGSFGEVYKVRSREDTKIYAIKQMKATHNYGFAEVENYEKVGDHRNCVKLVMAWEQSGVVHIQMEYCQLSLAQYSSLTGNIEESQLWDILYDMLKALDHLHKKQLIHLDIKPGNIMINRGYYKLADFGLLVDLNKHNGRKVSTISDGDSKYLACEVLDGIYTYACDIFGLGISILELATSIELPEFGPLWHKIRKEALPDPFYDGLTAVVTKPFAYIIQKMMICTHLLRPSAEKLLERDELREICMRDRKETRINYCAGIVDDWPFYNMNDDDNANNNHIVRTGNGIVDTPRRPLHEVRNSRSLESNFLLSKSPRTSNDSRKELQESTSADMCSTRRGLSRTKLAF